MKDFLKKEILKVFSVFKTKLEIIEKDFEIFLIPSGHINISYLLTHTPTNSRFIIQKLNTIFDISAIDFNLHLFEQCQEKANFLPSYWQRIHYLNTKKSNSKIFYDSNKNPWRVMEHLRGNIKIFNEFNEVSKEKKQEIAESLGSAIAIFSRILKIASVEKWKQPLPNFHNAFYHYDYLKQILDQKEIILNLSQDKARKVKLNKAFLKEYDQRIKELLQKIEKRKRLINCLDNLELIATHGDLKINNLVFKKDESGDFKCISLIDLDTIQKGTILDDLGDALRSAGNPAGEEPGSLDDIKIDIDIVRNIISGFLKQRERFEGREKAEKLKPYILKVFSQFLYTQCIRFFADSLIGNKYFSLKESQSKDLNLYRAEVQMRVLERLEKLVFLETLI